MMPLSWLVPIIIAITPREEAEYTLLSADGRYLVAGESGTRLLTPDEADGTNAHYFTFVRVPGRPRKAHVFLRFGDALLSAPASASAPFDAAASAQFRLFTRPSDGHVALEAPGGTLLRAAGSAGVAQGGVPTDEAVWWRLQPAGDAPVECPADAPRLWHRGPSSPRAWGWRRHASAAAAAEPGATVIQRTRSRGGIATSTAMIATTGAALLPASAFGTLTAVAAQPPVMKALSAIGALLPNQLRAAALAAGGALRGMGAAALQFRDAQALAARLMLLLVPATIGYMRRVAFYRQLEDRGEGGAEDEALPLGESAAGSEPPAPTPLLASRRGTSRVADRRAPAWR